jgi:hypothetical protein
MEIPKIPTLAELPYPSEIKKKQKEMNALYSAWVEEDDKVLELEEQIRDMELQDARALKEAAMVGQPDPGAPNTAEAERSLAYHKERALHLKRETEKTGRELRNLVKAHRKEIISMAILKARAGVDSWRDSLVEISELQIAASEARSKSLDGVRMISNWGLTSDVLRFDPFFPTTGSFSSPSPNEVHLLRTLEGLERMLLQELDN